MHTHMSPWGRLKWPSAITKLTAYLNWDLMPAMVIAMVIDQQRKEYGYIWHRMSLLRPAVCYGDCFGNWPAEKRVWLYMTPNIRFETRCRYLTQLSNSNSCISKCYYPGSSVCLWRSRSKWYCFLPQRFWLICQYTLDPYRLMRLLQNIRICALSWYMPLLNSCRIILSGASWTLVGFWYCGTGWSQSLCSVIGIYIIYIYNVSLYIWYLSALCNSHWCFVNLICCVLILWHQIFV